MVNVVMINGEGISSLKTSLQTVIPYKIINEDKKPEIPNKLETKKGQ